MILVVDDDAAVRELARAVLVREGHDVVAVASAEAALAAARVFAVEAIVSDLHMPGGSGLDLLAALRAQGSPPPFVLVTASDPADYAARAERLGVAATLRKPFGLTTLAATVAAVLPRAGGGCCAAPPPPRAA